MPITVLDFAKARVSAALAEISKIKSPGLPRETTYGLELIEAEFVKLQRTLAEELDVDNDPGCIKDAARITLYELYRYLPLIGFMLRSTNVRNAFELHGPLVSIAHQVLGDGISVVLSSEWEFSPFVYRPIVELPGFVLIGLPATESGNGLIVPLAGHELGHAIYQRRDLQSNIAPQVAAALVHAIEQRWDEYHQFFDDLDKNDLAGPAGQRTWAPSFDWAVEQCEESFCDFFGLRLFGESYLYAFAYLLAPCLPHRSPSYPKMTVRVRNLVTAANSLDIPIPDGFEDNFYDGDEDFLPLHKLLCSLADEAVAKVVSSLIEQVKNLAQERCVPDRDEAEIKKAFGNFRLVMPALTATNLATVANAGWIAHQDPTLWNGYPDVADRRQEVLNDLVLKSAEILEIRERLKRANLNA